MVKRQLKVKFFLSLVTAIIVLIPLVSRAEIPILDYKNNKGVFKKDLNVTAKGSGYKVRSPEQIDAIKIKLIKVILQYILGFLGVLFLVLLLWAGYEWMFSGGNEERVTKAKKRVQNAVNGLIIVLAAYILTNFIFDALMKSTIATTT